MEPDKADYPLYRKYAHGRTYFKVISAKEFEELRLENGRWVAEVFRAEKYPSHTFIYDLTHAHEKHWVEIAEEEYLEKRKLCRDQ